MTEAAMGSMTLRQKFDPLDLEIIDRVYEVACAYIEARDLYRDTDKDAEEEDFLRKRVFALAGLDQLCFDTLCDAVIASIDEYRKPPQAAKQCSRPRETMHAPALCLEGHATGVTSAFGTTWAHYRGANSGAP